MHITAWSAIVNHNCVFLLDILPSGAPALICPHHTFELDDAPLTAVILRTSLKTLKSTPAGAAWFAAINPMKVTVPPELRLPPRDYQKIGHTRMKISSCDLWWDMGLGKCYMCLWYTLTRYKETGKSVYVIICPQTIFGTWENQIDEHLTIKPRVVIAHGPKKAKRLAELRTSPAELTFVFTTYETLSAVIDALEQCPIGAIFMDEVSRAKNFDAQRTQHCHKFVNTKLADVPRFGLSGTPSTTKVEGYYSLYELLGHGKSGCMNLAHWKNRYIEYELFFIVRMPDGTEKHVHNATAEQWLYRHHVPGTATSFGTMGYSFSDKPTGAKQLRVLRYYNKAVNVKNIDQLQDVTRLNALCLKKEDVLQQLPEKTYMRRIINMNEAQEKAYHEIAASMRTEIEGKKISFKTPGSPFAKLHQIANGYILDANGEFHDIGGTNTKLTELENLIEEAGDEKIIIWSPFIKQIEQVTGFLKKLDLKVISLYGATTPEARRTFEKRFRDEAQFAVANPAVAGLGMNLAFSHLQIYMTNWYAPDIRAQAEDRQHRSGQISPVTIVDLLSRGTLEFKILNTLFRRVALEDQILSMRDVLGEAA